MKNGCFYLPFEEYLKEDGMSSTILKVLRDRSPSHAKERLKNPVEPSAAMRLGSLTHALILEPSLDWKTEFSVQPEDLSLNSKEGRAWKAEQAGKKILKAYELESAVGMAEKVHQHPITRELFSAGIAEQSAFCFDQQWGLQLKARWDWVSAGNCICDIKTCESAAPQDFIRTMERMHYYLQAAFYIHIAQALGLQKHAFVFIAIEKEPPYEIGVYNLDFPTLEYGRKECARLLEKWKKCLDTGFFPGYGDKIKNIGVRDYMLQEVREPEANEEA